MTSFYAHWQSWAIGAGTLVGAVLISLAVRSLVFSLLERIGRRSKSVVDASLVRHGRRPSKIVFPLIALLIAVPTTSLPPWVEKPLEHVIGLGLIASVAWAVILLADVVADVIVARNRIDVKDNLAARRMQTQVTVLRRVFAIVVIIVTLAIMLLTIPHVRTIGTSLLASAGLAGLVVGMAMKPTFGNLVAGIQIALTQPIRVEDAVIVEDQWGWIEEITSTYVVVRIWNWQRMVLPLTYFIEHPFQNWTRTTACLIGSVHLFVDYTTSIDDLRKELERLVRSTDKWMGKVCVLQVVEATDKAIQLRALADAPDAGTAWDLRCYIREGLIKYLQAHCPDNLPKLRTDLQHLPAAGIAENSGPADGDQQNLPAVQSQSAR